MSVRKRIDRLRIAIRSAGAIVAIGLITVVLRFGLGANAPTVGFIYIIATLLIATTWGLAEAVVASVVATVCFNFFFLPPVHTFRIADPENWVALLTLLFASLLSSELSERARRRAADALGRQKELEHLHAVSRAILLSGADQPVGGRLAEESARVYGAASVAIYDSATGQTYSVGAPVSASVEHQLRDCAAHGGTFYGEGRRTVVTAFGLGPKPTGSIALTAAAMSDEARESLANLVAIGLGKARNQEAAARAEAARQMQEFKSTLLDALAHEFKTPLTTVKAAATAMTNPAVIDSGQQREFASIIEQEADRLTRLVTDAIQLARIEAGTVQVDKRLCDVHTLVESAAKELDAARGDRKLYVSVPDDLPQLHADGELMQLVLRQLIDNALKYSAAQSPIRVSARHSSDFIWITVQNQGPLIPQYERARLFEKFYRGTTAGPQTTGTGMGLAIVKEIMSAHGGEVRVESRLDTGTEVSILIPCASQTLVLHAPASGNVSANPP